MSMIVPAFSKVFPILGATAAYEFIYSVRVRTGVAFSQKFAKRGLSVRGVAPLVRECQLQRETSGNDQQIGSNRLKSIDSQRQLKVQNFWPSEYYFFQVSPFRISTEYKPKKFHPDDIGV